MLVIPNCIVKPTAAMAMTDMLTRPKPNAATKRFTAFGPSVYRFGLCPARVDDGRSLLGRQLSDLDLVAILVVRDEDIARLRVVVLVELVLAACTHETDRLACLESSDAVLISVDDHRAARAVADVDDLRVVHGPVGAVGGDHRQRGHDDPVVQVERGSALLVLGCIRKLGRGGVEVGDELGVSGSGERIPEVHASVVLEKVGDADRITDLL